MNELYVVKKLSSAEFEEYSSALSPMVIPIEQTPLWGAFNNLISDRTQLGSFSYHDETGRLVALFSAVLYRQRGRNWIWIKHGPLFAHVPNTEVIQNVCRTLKHQFARVDSIQPLFIRLSMPAKTPLLKKPFESTMYDQTVVVDLTQTEDELFSAMSQSGRQGVRKALKHNVQIEEVITNRLEMFEKQCYPILQETSTRDKFGIHPLSLYLSMLKALPETARLYVALHEDKAEAWAITTEYGGRGLYYYGGSSFAARKTHAAYLLHWEIMKQMKQRGTTEYDLMGIASENYQSLKNVTQFKLKFSKNIVSIPTTYDLPLQLLKYRALSTAIKSKRRFQ